MVIELLAHALEPEAPQDRELAETASEQVARTDVAIRKALSLLSRIADPDALTDEQAEGSVQRLLGEGLNLDEVLQREWEESGMYGTRGLLATLKRLVSTLGQHRSYDRCCCEELGDGGGRCLFCQTDDALDLGGRWLRMLDLPQKSAGLPGDGVAWERLWYFSEPALLQLIADIRRDAYVHGYSVNLDLGPQQEPVTMEDLHMRLQSHVERVLAPFAALLERVGEGEETLAFVRAYAAYWIFRGHIQGRDAATEFEQRVRLRVHHRDAPDLDWGTTQSALELCTILPDLILSIMGDGAFEDLSWSIAGVRYYLTRCEKGRLDLLHTGDGDCVHQEAHVPENTTCHQTT
jgi:hypothetical protein